MSELLIRGMKMPICCMFCPLSNSAGCGLTNPPVLMTPKEMLADRPDWCPLVHADDVRPVVRGKWVRPARVPDSMLSECSVCGFDTGAYTFNYCPNCGAKMEES